MPEPKSSEYYREAKRRSRDHELITAQTLEAVRALFHKVSRLQDDIQTLTKAVAQSNQLWLTLCEDSETRRHVEAVMKKFNQERSQ